MNIIIKKAILIPAILLLFSCSSPGGNDNTTIHLKTTLGDIKILLYDGTPIHRDNFINLINNTYYEGISFHRVIKDFMIQAGDIETKTAVDKSFPDSLKSYTIPAEFNNQYFHKKGALAAARQANEINPFMRSSGTQFYIVQGIRYSDAELNQAEQIINSNVKQNKFNNLIRETTDSIRSAGKIITDSEIQELASIKMFQYLSDNKDFKYSQEQRNLYKTLGGTPRLDATYTVFGEVIEGIEVVDKIAAVPTDNYDRPLNDIKILKIKIEK